MTQMLCLVYCMVACVFGIAFPVSDALASREGHHTYYTEVSLPSLQMQLLLTAGVIRRIHPMIFKLLPLIRISGVPSCQCSVMAEGLFLGPNISASKLVPTVFFLWK